MTSQPLAATKKLPHIGQQRAKPAPAQQDPAWKKAQLGLARVGKAPQEAVEPEGQAPSYAWATNEKTSGYVTDETGEVQGTESERELTAGAGARGHAGHDRHRSDGKTVTDLKGSADALAGAEATCKLLAKHTKEEISVGIETLARAGAFGELKQTAAIKRGVARAGVEAKAKGGAGIEATMAAEAKIDRSGAVPALLATMEAGIKGGIWADGKFKGTAGLGPVEASLLAEINVLLGAEAKVEAKAFANLFEGVGAEFSAEGFAGARVKGDVGVELGIPHKAKIELGAEGEAMAGAMAKLEAKARISLTGVSLAFEAEAFAGAKASASIKGAVKAKGRTLVSAKGTVEVLAGAGGKAKGKFVFINGKLSIDAQLAAALGIGSGAELDAEIDFGAMADIIYASCYELGASSADPVVKEASPDFKREPLTDPVAAERKRKIGYDAVYDSFLGYSRKKAMKGSGVDPLAAAGPGVNRAEEGIKKERVQAIIKDVAPMIRADLAYVETDQGIQDAALDAFRGQLSALIVQHGAIRSWTPVERQQAAANRAEIQAEEKMRKARDPLLDELHAYCRKKMTEGKNGVKQGVVQEIVSKHHAKLKAVFTQPGEADEVISFVGEEMVKRYLADFQVKDGQITKFVVDPAKVKAVKDGEDLKKADAQVATALTGLGARLETYLDTMLAGAGRGVDVKGLNREIAAGTAKIKSQLTRPEVNERIRAVLTEKLGEAVLHVDLKDGVVLSLGARGDALGRLRAQRAGDAVATRRQAAADQFGRTLAAYREKKTSKGAVGLKQARVQELIDAALKKEADWKSSGQADAALKAAAEKALGPDLIGMSLTNGVVETFNFDNAKLGQDKAHRQEFGTSLFGGADDDNQRRSVVTAAVRTPLKAMCDAFRAESERDSTARLDAKRLDDIVAKATSKVRAEAASPVGGEALADAIKLYLPMVKDVRVDRLKVTTLVVNNAFYGGLAEQKTVRDGTNAIIGALKKQRKQMTIDLANQILTAHKPKLASLSGEDLDAKLTMAVAEGLQGSLARMTPVEVKAGVITKLLIAKR